jgi:hypothetical protein
MLFASAEGRCDSQLCEDHCSKDESCRGNGHFWTSTPCTLRVKIDQEGNVAIVHAPSGLQNNDVIKHVQDDTKTFFRVDWSADSAGSLLSRDCESIDTCYKSSDGLCVCDVSVSEGQVFSGSAIPSVEEILTSLPIGAFGVSLSNFTASSSCNGVTKYTVSNGATLTPESVFEVVDDAGVTQLRKNTRSVVHITGTNVSFRNPPHFMNLADPERRDAGHETDATLEHYFYHPNTAPFLAIRFAQRFGISNPSPRYIERIATAFQSGYYVFTEGETIMNFGSGEYGDLAATVACVLLDQETRDFVLDSDPMHGSLKEPLLKVIALMRSLEFKLQEGRKFVEFDLFLGKRIGQMAHELPSVFSFFLPEYQPSGPVAQGILVAPEAQVLTGPRIIETVNGLVSLIKFGLDYCYEGFAFARNKDVRYGPNCIPGATSSLTLGRLTYRPDDMTSAASVVVDELAMLMTSGRLSSANRHLVEVVYSRETDVKMAILKAQQLIATTPEFHSTGMVRRNGGERPEPEIPAPSSKPYKALVYLMFNGGMDSFNMLVPHSCSGTNDRGATPLEQYLSERVNLALTDAERYRVINANGQGQPCESFVVHPKLAIVQRLYRQGDLSFFANTGVINRPLTKENYADVTVTQLFAHNTMQVEAQRVDPFDGAPGTGLLGRLCDALVGKGFRAQPITVSDSKKSGNLYISSNHNQLIFLPLKRRWTWQPSQQWAHLAKRRFHLLLSPTKE